MTQISFASELKLNSDRNHNDQKQKVLIKSEISQKSIRNVFETIQMLKQKKEMVYQKKKAKSTLRKSI
jgi:hypothetical protein